MAYIDGPAGRLWIEHVGEGAPVTVFAHGLGSSSADLRRMAERTTGTSVLFDFRGHGASDAPPPEAGYDHVALAADLHAVADHAGATVALGVSMGAGAILRILTEEPDRFERNVFVIPSRIDDPCPDVPGTLRMADELEREPIEQVADRMMDNDIIRHMIERDPHWATQIRGQLLRMNNVGVPRAFRAYATGAPPVDDPEVLRRVQAPALIASNIGDPNHPLGVSQRLASLFPRAELRTFEDFAMFIDALDDFAHVVSAFLTE